MAIRVVIIEDEPATARHLASLLHDIDPIIEVTAMLSGIKDSSDWLARHGRECDLLFMDIRLNDGSSFEIFDLISVEAPVIFVTAYNEYALQAFKSNGIDYILKPFDEKELKQALAKFNRLSGTGINTTPTAQIRSIADEIKRSSYKSSFLVHFREKLVPLKADEIAWFYTVKEVVYAHTLDDRSFVVDFTLEQLQVQLDPKNFFRANRQFIVQRKSIKEINFYFNGRLLLNVTPEPVEKMLISKARVPEFKAWMNE